MSPVPNQSVDLPAAPEAAKRSRVARKSKRPRRMPTQ